MKRYALILLLPIYIGLAHPILDNAKSCTEKSESVPTAETLSRIYLTRTGNVPTDCNNPGALRISSNEKVMLYASGYYQTEGNGKFLVFDIPQHGYFALQEVLKDYGESSMFKFIKRYAPKIENDTDKYLVDLCTKLGVTPRTKVKDCNQIALMATIAKIEGFKE